MNMTLEQGGFVALFLILSLVYFVYGKYVGYYSPQQQKTVEGPATKDQLEFTRHESRHAQQDEYGLILLETSVWTIGLLFLFVWSTFVSKDVVVAMLSLIPLLLLAALEIDAWAYARGWSLLPIG